MNNLRTRGTHLAILLLALVVLLLTRQGSEALFQRLVEEYEQSIAIFGFSPTRWAFYFASLTIGSVIFHIAVAALIAIRRPREQMALLVAMTLISNGALQPLAQFFHQAPPTGASAWALRIVVFTGLVTSIAVIAVFPSGVWRSDTRLYVAGWALLHLPGALAPASRFAFSRWPLALQIALLLIWTSLGAWLIVTRYRHTDNPVQRQQMKWASLGLVAALAGPLAYFIPFVIAPSIALPHIPNLFVQRVGVLLFSVVIGARLIALTIFPLISLLFPLSFAIAVLRYRLWDVDYILNRTAVYTLLSGGVLATYSGVVLIAEWLLPFDDDSLPAAIAAGGVVLLFQPLRVWLQQRVNRRMYGQRDEPLAVLARLGDAVSVAAAPEDAVGSVVTAVARALRLPYVAVAIRAGAGEHILAAAGTPGDTQYALPVTAHGVPFGRLLFAYNPGDERLSAGDEQLLQTVAHQIGAALAANQVAAELARTQAGVARARTEEIARLRRDLHDGVGPRLATLNLLIMTARNVAAADPERAQAVLNEFKQQAQETIADIRRLVYDLRPPALDQLGLPGAVQRLADAMGNDTLTITIRAPQQLPRLSAAVEVAAYRIAVEALTNVVRHSGASRCDIVLEGGAALTVIASDNGRGVPDHYMPGVGLQSMRERATELGGTLSLQTSSTGTRITAVFPLSPQQNGDLRRENTYNGVAEAVA